MTYKIEKCELKFDCTWFLFFQVAALTLQAAEARKKAEEEAEAALALEEARKKIARDLETAARQIDELQQANDKLEKSEPPYQPHPHTLPLDAHYTGVISRDELDKSDSKHI